MKIHQQLRFIVIHKHADSLHSLIADGQYCATSLGREKWKKLIGSQGSLQYNCNKEGFNVVCSWSGYSKARIGIVQGDLAIQTRAVTRPMFLQIMETNTSKPWDTSWYNKCDPVFAKKKTYNMSNSHCTYFSCFKRNPSDRDLCPCITLVFTLDQPLAILSTKPTKENLRYQVENSLM